MEVNGMGPTAIAKIDDIASPDTVKRIAGVYLSAFLSDSRAYPYLVR